MCINRSSGISQREYARNIESRPGPSYSAPEHALTMNTIKNSAPTSVPCACLYTILIYLILWNISTANIFINGLHCLMRMKIPQVHNLLYLDSKWHIWRLVNPWFSLFSRNNSLSFYNAPLNRGAMHPVSLHGPEGHWEEMWFASWERAGFWSTRPSEEMEQSEQGHFWLWPKHDQTYEGRLE